MPDTIVLLEERKEVTTFLLDEGTITQTTVATPTGETQGYDMQETKSNRMMRLHYLKTQISENRLLKSLPMMKMKSS